MSTVVYVLEVVVALGLVILVHELGHFLTAKWFGVHVRRFAIGMGPPLVRWQRGETEYSLRWLLPLGGFVDMAGEDPSAEGADDPRGLSSKPAWQRLVVFASGVAMNGALAVVLFTVAPLLGIQVPTTEVGDVVPDMPAAAAGIQAGDRIVSIDGEAVESYDDIANLIASQREGTAFQIVVERQVAGEAAPKRLPPLEVRSTRKSGQMAPMVGIAPALNTTLYGVVEHSPEEQAGLRKGDRIVSVNGQPVDRWNRLARILEEAPAGPLTLRIERDGLEQDLAVDPAKLKVFQWGMDPPTLVRAVEKGGPAAGAGVKAGDRVARLVVEPAANAAPLPDGQAPRGSAKSWPTHEELSETIRAAGPGATVRLTLLRRGEYVDATCQTVILKGEDRPRIGIATAPAVAEPVQIGRAEPDGAAAKADLQPGDVVLSAGKDDRRVASWEDLIGLVLAEADQPVPVTVRRGQIVLTTLYRPDFRPMERFVMSESLGEPVFVPMPRFANPLWAVARGLKRTYVMLVRAYSNLRQLVTGQVSTDMMLGPVSIVRLSVAMAAYGVGTFMDFWGMLSVFIAVLNFLPVPPLDGGHALFVLIEKAKGSRVSMRVRQAFWIAGWVAFGVLIVFVTFQDIRHWVTGP